MSAPEEGDTHVRARTFTEEDVRTFAEFSGDDQPRHVEPDAQGRVLVQGLLTATLLTDIGGDLEVLAHTIDLEFSRPVYAGDRVVCVWTTESVAEHDRGYAVEASVTCTRDDDVVLEATVQGIVEA